MTVALALNPACMSVDNIFELLTVTYKSIFFSLDKLSTIFVKLIIFMSFDLAIMCLPSVKAELIIGTTFVFC